MEQGFGVPVFLKVVHYNTFAEGGSAVLMLRLHHALLAMGHASGIRYRTGNLQVPGAQVQEYCRSWLDRQRERMGKRFESWAMVPGAPSYFGRCHRHRATPPPAADSDADIVHLHWINHWLDLPSFLAGVPERTPIVWTVHDMSPLAGGCFTDFGCDQLGKGCRACPLLRRPFDRLLAARDWQRRWRALAGRKVVLVGNSAFTTGLIRKARLVPEVDQAETIKPGLNLTDWVRHDQAEARRLLGVDPGCFVLGFGAAILTDENKGFGRFMEVAEIVGKRLGNVEALVFGDGLAAAGNGRVKVHALGRLSSPRLLSLVYSAMDAFILTSRMETFGQVATEAQACGTPAYAFDVGGLRDAIQDGVTGSLVPFPDTAKMAEQICLLADRGDRSTIRDRAAEWARQNFAAEQMADRYLKVYAAALSSWTAPAGR